MSKEELCEIIRKASKQVLRDRDCSSGAPGRPPWDPTAVWFLVSIAIQAKLDIDAALHLMWACEARSKGVSVEPEDVESTMMLGAEEEGEDA